MHPAAVPDQRARQSPGAPGIADERQELDNESFARQVRRVAAWLSSQGIGRGDVIAVMLPNRVELVTLLFAAWRIRAAVTPVNPLLTREEVAYQLADSAARLVVVDEAAASTVCGLATPSVQVGELAELAESPAPDWQDAPDDLALLIYTSGTTGRPKGVMLDHANLMAMTSMLTDCLELTSADRCLLILPLFHVNGIMVGVLAPLTGGGSVIVAPRFQAATFWPLVERQRPTYFSAVPTIYARLLEDAADKQIDVSSLRFVICGAAPMPADMIDAFEARFGVPVIEGYGLSESTVACTINPLHGTRKPGTVGIPLPGQEVRVFDANGHEVAQGEAGEVVVRGPNVMRGYLGKPEETARTIRDGWLWTGDIGRFDADGYLVLVDRSKDMIIRGGENIYPVEIENALYRHPAVFEAAVVGRPHPQLGEEPVAFVVLRAGVTATPEELLEHLRGLLARYKLPQAIYLESALPKNAVGKIVKAPLRDRLTARV